MSELSVDIWVALSVIPMVIALCIYLWLSKRFDRNHEREIRRYEDLIAKAQEPLSEARADGSRQMPPPPPPPRDGA